MSVFDKKFEMAFKIIDISNVLLIQYIKNFT